MQTRRKEGVFTGAILFTRGRFADENQPTRASAEQAAETTTSVRMKRLAQLVVFLVALLSRYPAFSFETSYWAWQRSEPPSESDLAELSAQEVRTLYWHSDN